MRVMKSGGSLSLPNIPVLHLSIAGLVLLLGLCVIVSGYCYYRYKGGKSIRRIVRKKIRHRRRRKRTMEQSTSL
jgi:hypothetical protein